MKILHITSNFYPTTGGIETFIYEISKRMIRKGNNVTVITSNKTPFENKILKRHEVIDGINVIRVPFHLFFRYGFSIEALKMALSSNWDVIHIHNIGFFTDTIPILKLKGKKIFLHTHGGIFHTKNLNILKHIYFNSFLRLSTRFVDKVIAHSLNDKKLFSKICREENISLLNYGIDWKKLSREKRKSNGKTLIYTGRLSENKRLERTMFIIYCLKKQIPNIKLLLVGGDWGEKEKLTKLAKKLNISENINFINSVQHKGIYKYLSKADAFLLSSDYEGFGISVIEAMASGLTVVVNDILPMGEIVTDRRDGFITDFNDYEKTAKLILNILKSKKLRNMIGNRAKKMTKTYDWDQIIKKMEKIYGT